jgi:uncharacterized protein (TIGR03437 family)
VILSRTKSSYLCAGFLIAASAGTARAQAVSFALSSGSGAAGGTVVLNLSLSGPTAPAALQWKILYSTADVAGITHSIGPAATAAGKSISCSNPTGAASCVIYAVNKNTIAPGVVAQLTVQLKSTPSGSSTSIQFATALYATPDGNGGTAATTNGTINIGSSSPPPGPALSSLNCPSTILAGAAGNCTVSLTSAAGSGGVPVSLSGNVSGFSVPASVTVPAGSASAQFTAASTLTDVDRSATITASLGSTTRSATVSIIGLRPVSLTCSPASILPGGSSTCTISLNRAPNTGTAVLSISDNSSDLLVPSSITTSAARTQYTFTARARSVAAAKTVAVSASYLSTKVTTNVQIVSSQTMLSVPAQQTVTAGTVLSFPVEGGDPSGAPVSLRAPRIPAGATFNPVSQSLRERDADLATGVFEWKTSLADVGTHRVTLSALGPSGEVTRETVVEVVSPAPRIHAIVNAASRSAGQACSPGGLAALSGTALQGNDSRVMVNGEAAQIVSAMDTEIVFVCPSSAPGSVLEITVETGAGTSNRLTAVMGSASPGIFTLDGSGSGQGAVLVAGSNEIAMVSDPNVGSRTAARGELVRILATGLEGTPAVTIGDQAATVVGVHAGQQPGVTEVAVQIPEDVRGGDRIPLKIALRSADGRVTASNTVTIAIGE